MLCCIILAFTYSVLQFVTKIISPTSKLQASGIPLAKHQSTPEFGSSPVVRDQLPPASQPAASLFCGFKSVTLLYLSAECTFCCCLLVAVAPAVPILVWHRSDTYHVNIAILATSLLSPPCWTAVISTSYFFSSSASASASSCPCIGPDRDPCMPRPESENAPEIA